MKKKIVLALLMAALLAGGAFAQSLSAGLGGNFGIHTTTWSGDGESETTNMTGGGFHAFFDANYVIVKVGMFIGGDSSEEDYGYGIKTKTTMTLNYFSLGLLGKYPIDLGGFTLFPMLGFEYNIFMSSKITAEVAGVSVSAEQKRSDFDDDASQLDQFILQLGVGADINLTDSIYLRPTLLWGIDLARSEMEKKFADAFDISIFKSKFDIGIAVGFRF